MHLSEEKWAEKREHLFEDEACQVRLRGLCFLECDRQKRELISRAKESAVFENHDGSGVLSKRVEMEARLDALLRDVANRESDFIFQLMCCM